MVREGDDHWADIVRWTLNALVLAESMKSKLAAQATVEAAARDPGPVIRRPCAGYWGWRARLAAASA